MREANFPFAKFRDWGATPETLPEIDTELVAELTSWQDALYRRPILDDITGYYQFYPTMNGASAYVTRAARNRPIIIEDIEDGDTLEAKQKRQELHIAETAELATALFWTTAIDRHTKLNSVLARVNDQSDVPLDDDSSYKFAADAIADYGFCLANPVDIHISGRDDGPHLRAQIERVAPGLGSTLLGFGNYAIDNPDALRSFDGIVAMQAAVMEQERRIEHWSPRHGSIIEAFPDTKVSGEVLYFETPLNQMFWLHEKVKVA